MAKTLKDKQVMYKQVFGNPAGSEVIRDLNRMCYGTRSTMEGGVDQLELARREGRREVFLQIINMLKVDIETVFEEYVDLDF